MATRKSIAIAVAGFWLMASFRSAAAPPIPKLHGPLPRISRIEFTGNSAVDRECLLKQISGGPRVWYALDAEALAVGVAPAAAMLDQATDHITCHYQSIGYADVAVRCMLESDNRANGIVVRFQITEGPRYRVTEVRLRGKIESMTRATVRKVIKLRPGDYYSSEAARDDVFAIQDLIGNTGRYVRVHDGVYWALNGRPGEALVIYEVHEGIAMTVGTIKIVGNAKTPRESILKQIALRPGEPLRFPELCKAERNLVLMRIFVIDPERGIRPTVDVLDIDSDNPVKDILIKVREAE